MEKEFLQKLKGRRILLDYTEQGRPSLAKGIVVSVSKQFLELQGFNDSYFIRIDSIQKIRIKKEGTES